ncbi:hypothetical protein LTR37_017884 [Vermiconidia calcicola]|uniref:Uncharacterized protein n=1 Tax=Vermiconidia calcicola TaxID=1690605 RepID=A0ACC3MK58_9PEZI|nr:hypothetical protein LTR37_017884 [Vermiconidia calcicola]
MNSRALRRLAADHGALHSQPLPPNYLFPPGPSDSDDLTQLDILLAGATHTPFVAGVWKLHLTIPPTYPQQAPTATFRTPIFHPNVDPQTGGVCVETLKRDWDSKLTLTDVLITISCLLIQPNPDSALNAEAGALIQEDYDAFARRAKLMTSIHAGVPSSLQAAVKEAQSRGQESIEEQQREESDERKGLHGGPDAPARRRRATAKQRGTAPSRRSDGSPSGGVARRRQQAGPSNPFVMQTGNDDVFGMSRSSRHDQPQVHEDDDSSMMHADQENDEIRSPAKVHTPKAVTPRRPLGAPVPLGELSLDEVSSDSSDNEAEKEYPPSPRKSPAKNPVKRRQQHSNSIDSTDRPESSRAAAQRALNTTPPNNATARPLAEDSPFVRSSALADQSASSPHKHTLFEPQTPAVTSRAPLFPSLSTPHRDGGIFKRKSPSSSEKKRQEARRTAELDAKLWKMCGKDIRRWNRGDFDGGPFVMKAKRW